MIDWNSSLLMIGSLEFAMIFVAFLFLFVLLRKADRGAMMLYVIAFNLFFAFRANGMMMLILPLSSIMNYAMTEWMRKKEGRTRTLILALNIILNLAPLLYFKYTNFFIADVMNNLFHKNFALLDLVVPMGISFFTFQALSYSIDVYRGTFNLKTEFLEYVFYLTFFPLLLAGPITRASNIIPALKKNKQATRNMVWKGLFLVMLGLIKKNVVADYLAQYNNWVFDAPSSFSGFENLMAVLGFSVQIFLDFSGYSDMSIGIASIMGFPLPDNFFFPYRSLNLTDFWRRWHISLSSWFRDYLYIPLGGNKKGTLRMCLNMVIVMLVSGLWHGASYMFLIWGFLHGLGLVVHKLFSRTLKWKIPSKLNGLSWLMTYSFVLVTWMFFRAENLTKLNDMCCKILYDFSLDYFLPFVQTRALWLVLLVGTMLSFLVSERCYDNIEKKFISLPWVVKLILLIICIQLALEISCLSVQPFIYSQF